MNSGIKKLAGRLLLLASPLFLCLIGYFVLDPFRVLRHHEQFYDEQPVNLNRDYVSTELFLRSYRERRPNAFVFGNSRSLAFRCDDWQGYLAADARPFHFDAFNESLFGIWTKFRFLDTHGLELHDALVVLDAGLLQQTRNLHSRLFIKHPALSGESSLRFQAVFASSFFARMFFVKYFDWWLFRERRSYMADVFDAEPMQNTPITNDLAFRSYEHELRQLGEDGYYSLHRASFPPRSTHEGTSVVGPTQDAMLAALAAIIQKHHTRLRIVVSPLYSQERLSSADHAVLVRHFGAENVYDFSGVNEWTENIRNFYEVSHYRPHVARALLRVMYGDPPGG